MTSPKRYELKFVLNCNDLNDARNWLYAATQCTARYRPRVVHSLYFDTPDYQCARDNLSGAAQRHKTRLRWYQNASGTCSEPTLEIKQKDGRLGAKQRYTVTCPGITVQDLPAQEISAALRRGLKADTGSVRQLDEVLQPVLYVRYLRDYYQDLDGLRVTLDTHISFRPVLAYHTLATTPKRAYPWAIMELKFPPVSKNRISRQLRPIKLRASRHSKYLTGLAVFGLVNYL